VENPSEFPDCGRYLGDLFTQPEASTEKTSKGTTGTTRDERYGY
jgi:hypothetical protein